MDLSSHRDGDVLVLMPEGRLDHTDPDAFQAALETPLAQCADTGLGLVLDLSAVESVASPGLRIFMLARKEAEAKAIPMALAALTPVVEEIFTISRFDTIFDLYKTRAQAAHALQK